VTADQGGQKNHNGRTIAVLFTMFSTSGMKPTCIQKHENKKHEKV
jgi:hypothetical protein